ncbi:MAG TPA: hypothetical protein VIK01_16035 [Polyangiaceae bacterium]
MSMHEFEDLVEQSIRLLATTGRPIEALRSSYAALYAFQGEWDTGYTHFRIIDLLLAAHFVYSIPISDYPDPVEGASVKGGWVTLAGHSAPTYCKEERLFIDAGSEAWSSLVAAGRLTGLDATAPSKLDVFELALDLCQLAEQAKDHTLIGMWYRLLGAHALMNELEGVEELSAVIALRALVKRTGALEIELDYGCLRTPSAEDRAEMPLLDWWFTL